VWAFLELYYIIYFFVPLRIGKATSLSSPVLSSAMVSLRVAPTHESPGVVDVPDEWDTFVLQQQSVTVSSCRTNAYKQ
jgi:hypothetical protein